MSTEQIPQEDLRIESNIAAVLDASGLTCPLPILRTKKALSSLESGSILKILVTDYNAVSDFQVFCEKTGNKLLSIIPSDRINTTNSKSILYVQKR